MKFFRVLWVGLVVLIAGWLCIVPVGAQSDEPTDDEVNAVARELYCPVCENIPLDVCPTQACAEWRELIRLKLAAGWTPEQVKQYFAEQYGDRVLSVPPARGFNWLVYIVPPLAILAGVYALLRRFAYWKKPPVSDLGSSTTAVNQTSQDEAVGVKDPYIALFEDELKKRS